MHRHGYKGRKFGRERDQREALIKGLADSLILNESIETTHEKAKDLRPYVEKLVTKARKGGLHNRRQVIKSLQTLEAAHKLVDDIAPKMQRTSGYLRIVKTTTRRGDNAQLARISFVDDLKAAPVSQKAEKAVEAKSDTKKAPVKKTVAKESK
jgi:large subunit ribosomal protein L17